MNRFAYLISAYTDPEHLDRLISALDDGFSDFYVHIDKKVSIWPFVKLVGDRAIFVRSIPVSWGEQRDICFKR